MSSSILFFLAGGVLLLALLAAALHRPHRDPAAQRAVAAALWSLCTGLVCFAVLLLLVNLTGFGGARLGLLFCALLAAVAGVKRWTAPFTEHSSRAAAALLWAASAGLGCFAVGLFLSYYTRFGFGPNAVTLASLLLAAVVGLWRWHTPPRASAPEEPCAPCKDAEPAAAPCPAAEKPQTALPPTELAAFCGGVVRGYLLIHLHLNLGTLDVLPDWAGYLCIVSQLGLLAGWQPAALLLRPLGFLLAGWNLVDWVCTLLGVDCSLWPVLPLVAAVVNLYFNFQLLTNLADAVAGYLPDEADRLRRLRTLNTLFLTLVALPLPLQRWQYAAVALLVLTVPVTALLWYRLRAVKRQLLALED